MAIQRKKQTRNYVEIPNLTAQDDSLTWEARGLLTFMLSKPEDFRIMPAYLVKCGNAGRDKIHKLLKELESNGYLVSNQARSDGKYGKSDYTVYDEKQTIQEYKDLEPCPENQLSVKQVESESSTNVPCPEMPYTAKPTLINTEKKKEQKSNSKRDTANAELSSEFNFDLVLAWILVQFQKTGLDLTKLDESFVEAKLESYQAKYKHPNKADALSFIEQGLCHRLGIKTRSAASSAARDNLNKSVCENLETRAAVIDNHTKNSADQIPKTTDQKLNDRSWAEGLEF